MNGSQGIAVGMATNIPPHNLAEVIDAVVVLLESPDAGIEDLMACVHGPTFRPEGRSWVAADSSRPTALGAARSRCAPM